MTAKEYLRQLKTLDNMINAKLLEKEYVRAMGKDNHKLLGKDLRW